MVHLAKLQNGAMTHYERLTLYNAKVAEVHPSFEMETTWQKDWNRKIQWMTPKRDPAQKEPNKVNAMNTEFLGWEEVVVLSENLGYYLDFYRTDQQPVFESYQSDSTFAVDQNEQTKKRRYSSD